MNTVSNQLVPNIFSQQHIQHIQCLLDLQNFDRNHYNNSSNQLNHQINNSSHQNHNRDDNNYIRNEISNIRTILPPFQPPPIKDNQLQQLQSPLQPSSVYSASNYSVNDTATSNDDTSNYNQNITSNNYNIPSISTLLKPQNQNNTSSIASNIYEPNTYITETPLHVNIEIELAGVSNENINIDYCNSILTVIALKKSSFQLYSNESVQRNSKSNGIYKRVMKIKLDSLCRQSFKCKLLDGVLFIRIIKPNPSGPVNCC